MKVFGAKFWAQKVAETRGKDHSKMMNTLRNMEAAMQKGDMHAVMGESSKSVDQTPTSAKGAGGAPGGGLVSDDDARAACLSRSGRQSSSAGWVSTRVGRNEFLTRPLAVRRAGPGPWARANRAAHPPRYRYFLNFGGNRGN